jgi:non-ribosomal peptide synthetase component F
MKSDGWLRTTFVPNGTTFLQVVKKTADLPWETSDMEVTEYMQQQMSKAMYPGELWWNAAALSNNVLVISSHHALFDFWSNEFLTQDLTSMLQGTPRIQRRGFRPYVEYLQQHDAVAMQNFWQGYLDGAVPSRVGSQVAPENTVTSKVHCDLKTTASQRRVTPGVLLYAAWAVVLSLANSTEDVVMGVTFSGRDAPVAGILQMSGPTLMIAPLRVKVNKSTPLDTHLENVQSNLWAIARNAPYGLRKILKASGQRKDLFDTMANFLIKIPAPRPVGGLRQLPESNLGTVEYTKVELRNESLDRVILTSTLEPGYAQALADTLAAVLDAAFNAPLTKLGEFKLVQPEPRLMHTLDDPLGNVPVSEAQLIKVDNRVESPGEELAHSALQRIAASHPSWTAVEDISGARITYAGLAIKMNQLAGLLRERGLELEQIVPIMLEKSINTIVAMFGILVAGGAFLPLGPENPRERNLGILEDSGAKLVITDQLNAEFFEGTSYDVIIIDAVAWDTIPLQRQVVPGLNPNSLAYVIYTSGRYEYRPWKAYHVHRLTSFAAPESQRGH